MRAGFQYREFSACVANFRQEALQVNRFGSGVGRRIFAGGRFVRDGAEKASFGFGSFDDRVNHGSSGGFAVSPRDGHELQDVARVVVKIRRGNRESFASLADLNGSNAGRDRRGNRLVAHHRDRAALYGVSDKRLSIFFFSPPGEENY